MLLTRNQFLIILAVLIVSCGAWGMLLKMFIDSSLALKWSLMVWFFGGCLVALVVGGSITYFANKNYGRKSKKYSGLLGPQHINCRCVTVPQKRLSDIKIEGEINPALTAFKQKLTEVKQAAEKGIDRE